MSTLASFRTAQQRAERLQSLFELRFDHAATNRREHAVIGVLGSWKRCHFVINRCLALDKCVPSGSKTMSFFIAF